MHGPPQTRYTLQVRSRAHNKTEGCQPGCDIHCSYLLLNCQLLQALQVLLETAHNGMDMDPERIPVHEARPFSALESEHETYIAAVCDGKKALNEAKVSVTNMDYGAEKCDYEGCRYGDEETCGCDSEEAYSGAEGCGCGSEEVCDDTVGCDCNDEQACNCSDKGCSGKKGYTNERCDCNHVGQGCGGGMYGCESDARRACNSEETQVCNHYYWDSHHVEG